MSQDMKEENVDWVLREMDDVLYAVANLRSELKKDGYL